MGDVYWQFISLESHFFFIIIYNWVRIKTLSLLFSRNKVTTSFTSACIVLFQFELESLQTFLCIYNLDTFLKSILNNVHNLWIPQATGNPNLGVWDFLFLHSLQEGKHNLKQSGITLSSEDLRVCIFGIIGVRIYCIIPDDLDDGGSKEPLNSHLNKDSLIPLWHQIWVILVCISPKEHTPNAIIKACKCRCISCTVCTSCATTCICCLATDIVDSKQLLE